MNSWKASRIGDREGTKVIHMYPVGVVNLEGRHSPRPSEKDEGRHSWDDDRCKKLISSCAQHLKPETHFGSYPVDNRSNPHSHHLSLT